MTRDAAGQAATDQPSFTLDYWRPNFSATARRHTFAPTELIQSHPPRICAFAFVHRLVSSPSLLSRD